MLSGFHHVTAIAGDPNTNLDFYTARLGMKLVKRTVNFDEVGTHHLYYGNQTGTPGSILTFFPWAASIRRLRRGPGMIVSVGMNVPSLAGWVPDDDGRVVVSDPDGMELSLTEGEFCIREITIAESEPGSTGELLTRHLDFEQTGRDVYQNRGATIRTVHLPGERGLLAPGGIHHVALAVESAEALAEWRTRLLAAGFKVTLVLDRIYFRSIYFRQLHGVLFEIATTSPGFFVDEEVLGSRLCLPPWLESSRASIEERLAPVESFSRG